MKKFKDLRKGDPVYILVISSESQMVKFRKSTCNAIILGSFGDNNNMKILFQEDKESPVVVHSEDCKRSTKLALTYSSKTFQLVYFSDIGALEIYLKDKIEELNTFRNKLESIYVKAWESVSEQKDDKNEEMLAELQPTKYSTLEYKKGDIVYNNSFDEAYIYDGGNKLYAYDGYCMNADVFFRLRLSTEEEKRRFLCDCRKIIMCEDKPKADLVINILKVCGYSWDSTLKDILHEKT